jgi:hypothetical protein
MSQDVLYRMSQDVLYRMSHNVFHHMSQDVLYSHVLSKNTRSTIQELTLLASSRGCETWSPH